MISTSNLIAVEVTKIIALFFDIMVMVQFNYREM